MKTVQTNDKTDKGLLYFAYNNEHLNYVSQATGVAANAKKQMPDIGLALVTSGYDLPFGNEHGVEPTQVFDHIYTVETPIQQYRVFRDGDASKHKLPYRNLNRPDAYDLSPFQETILVDSDYVIQDTSLNHCWGSAEPLMMNRKAVTVTGNNVALSDQRLNDRGIWMYWATVVYFQKSDFAEAFFGLVQHISEHYEYYAKVYNYNTGLYRNDFVFSVAAHMFNDFNQTDFISPLPVEEILTSYDKDLIIDVTEKEIKFFSYKHEEAKYYETTHLVPVRIDRNVHVMNKFALNKWLPELNKRL